MPSTEHQNYIYIYIQFCIFLICTDPAYGVFFFGRCRTNNYWRQIVPQTPLINRECYPGKITPPLSRHTMITSIFNTFTIILTSWEHPSSIPVAIPYLQNCQRDAEVRPIRHPKKTHPLCRLKKYKTICSSTYRAETQISDYRKKCACAKNGTWDCAGTAAPIRSDLDPIGCAMKN